MSQISFLAFESLPMQPLQLEERFLATSSGTTQLFQLLQSARRPFAKHSYEHKDFASRLRTLTTCKAGLAQQPARQPAEQSVSEPAPAEPAPLRVTKETAVAQPLFFVEEETSPGLFRFMTFTFQRRM